MRKHVTPSLIVSLAAIVIACAGSAAAASLITGKQIKNGSITAGDVKVRSITGLRIANRTISATKIKNSTITGQQIKDHSLTADDFDGSLGRGAAGPQGPTGPPGPAGMTGTTGPPGPIGIADLTRVEATGTNGLATATCPAGQSVVSGGGAVVQLSNHLAQSLASTGGNGWDVIGADAAGSTAGVNVYAYAYCSAQVTVTP